MLDLIFAAALLQGPPDPCYAAPMPRPLPAHCPRWQSTARSPDGEAFVNPVPLNRNGDTFEIQSRSDFREANLRERVRVSTQRYDCRRRTVTQVSDRSYAADGSLLLTHNPPNDPAFTRSIRPGDWGEGILARHCPR